MNVFKGITDALRLKGSFINHFRIRPFLNPYLLLINPFYCSVFLTDLINWEVLNSPTIWPFAISIVNHFWLGSLSITNLSLRLKRSVFCSTYLLDGSQGAHFVSVTRCIITNNLKWQVLATSITSFVFFLFIPPFVIVWFPRLRNLTFFSLSS